MPASTDQTSFFMGQKRKYSITKSTERFSNSNHGTYKV